MLPLNYVSSHNMDEVRHPWKQRMSPARDNSSFQRPCENNSSSKAGTKVRFSERDGEIVPANHESIYPKRMPIEAAETLAELAGEIKFSKKCGLKS